MAGCATITCMGMRRATRDCGAERSGLEIGDGSRRIGADLLCPRSSCSSCHPTVRWLCHCIRLLLLAAVAFFSPFVTRSLCACCCSAGWAGRLGLCRLAPLRMIVAKIQNVNAWRRARPSARCRCCAVLCCVAVGCGWHPLRAALSARNHPCCYFRVISCLFFALAACRCCLVGPAQRGEARRRRQPSSRPPTR